MWGSAATEPPGGGFGRGVPPPAENFAILGTENHVLMHFRTTFWGYNVDYLLCLVTLQLKMMIFFFLIFFFFDFFFFFFFFLIFFFFFFFDFFFKNVKIRGNPRIRGEISCLLYEHGMHRFCCNTKVLWRKLGLKFHLTHSEQRPKNIYSQEEMKLYCIIKLATEISLFSLQISKTCCFG